MCTTSRQSRQQQSSGSDVRRGGSPPEFLALGGIFWLIAVPAFWLVAIVVLSPLSGMFGDCQSSCPPKLEEFPSAVIPSAIGLILVSVVLFALLRVARLRPRVGYPIFGAIGAGILFVPLAGFAVSREPALLIILAGWPGWSGIAFVVAALRARRAVNPTDPADLHAANLISRLPRL